MRERGTHIHTHIHTHTHTSVPCRPCMRGRGPLRMLLRAHCLLHTRRSTNSSCTTQTADTRGSSTAWQSERCGCAREGCECCCSRCLCTLRMAFACLVRFPLVLVLALLSSPPPSLSLCPSISHSNSCTQSHALSHAYTHSLTLTHSHSHAYT